jgi:hypothetical protein
LIAETERAISERLKAPESFRKYESQKDREYPYYRIHVKNYIVFYVVISDTMEVRRFLYNRRNIADII